MKSALACEDTSLDIGALADSPCYGGLDLSGKQDLTALALYWPEEKVAYVEFWTPKDTLLERARGDRVPYDAWLRNGYLHAPPGSAINLGFVAKRIAELSARYTINSIAYDSYHIDYLRPELENEGVSTSLTSHGQGFGKSKQSGLWMPRSIELFEQSLLSGELRIDFNPCLRWNAANAVIEEDKNGNRVFSKRRSNGRIDGMVALAMAIEVAEAVEEETGDLDGFLNNPVIVGL